MLRRHLGWMAALCLLGLPPLEPSAEACAMVPFDYAGDVDQSGQDVVVLHHAGHEELILRIRPFFHEATETPASLAWLVTVPSAPTAYKVIDATIFTEARKLHERLERLYLDQKPTTIRSMLGANIWGADGVVTLQALDLEIDEQVRVGPYTITPIRARGAQAVDQLNRYLKSNGFRTEDPAHLAWFAKNEFTFLCIKIRPPGGSVQLGRHLDLIPLQIAFAAERPYYPGMYSANQGDFGLKLTLLTTQPVQLDALSEVGLRLKARQGRANLFTTQALPALLAGASTSAGEDGAPERWYLNGLSSRGFNPTGADGKPEILSWTEDVTWALGGEQDLPPSWYYGDGSKPILHRDHLFLVGWTVLLAALVLWLRHRRRRSRLRRAV